MHGTPCGAGGVSVLSAVRASWPVSGPRGPGGAWSVSAVSVSLAGPVVAVRRCAPARVPADVDRVVAAPLAGARGAAPLLVHQRPGRWRALGPGPALGLGSGGCWAARVPPAKVASHGVGWVLGRPVSGSGDDARGLTSGSVGSGSL